MDLSCRMPIVLLGIATGFLLAAPGRAMLPPSDPNESTAASSAEPGTLGAGVDLQDEQLRLSARNMNAIMTALHSYHNSAGHFPTAHAGWGFDRKTNEWYCHRRHLSWRVLLLPFLGEKELFDKFRLDQPWDSEHNKALISEMPDVYRTPGSKAGVGQTNYLGVVGLNAAFRMKKPPTTIIDMVDGTVNTMMVVEASDDAAVPWTRPRDFSTESDALVGLRAGGCLTVFADGATHFISEDASKGFLQSLFTCNDRQPIDQGKWKEWARSVRPSIRE